MKFYKSTRTEKNNKDNNEASHILLENIDEVNVYLENTHILWQNSINAFSYFNTLGKEERAKAISHTCSKDPVTALTGLISSMWGYETPVSPNVVSDFYKEQMIDFFYEKENIFVNKVGGYMYVEAFDIDNDFELIQDIDLKKFLSFDNHSFEYSSSENKFLVLENDPILDSWTSNKFNNQRIPYICSLRETMAEDKFEKLCKRALSYGIKKIFVYTTGTDYEQMEEYIKRTYDCGFREYEWIINNNDFKNREDNLKEFLNNFKEEIDYKISYI